MDGQINWIWAIPSCPNISDFLNQLDKCGYFTTLDLSSGFYQLNTNLLDFQTTAFAVINGPYKLDRTPFGLKTAPCWNQKVVLSSWMTSAEAQGSLQTSTLRLLKFQAHKCKFLRQEIAYLSHLITTECGKPNPS